MSVQHGQRERMRQGEDVELKSTCDDNTARGTTHLIRK